ncbi:ATP-binding protein [Leisingera sp. MMG026]|uniref:sensor histidine kinase n=1 Tax=Leisingera sp. MMG026 TaxID=2909982 RepID=UPI001F451DDB|nr:ATP-binding protein [Leisingera sp. MMG026]MCF6432474.1 ATP-binding protein [Leisingera sp. MMG026]
MGQLLEVVVDERAELGEDAEMAEAAPVIVSCRVNAVQRCLSNLVENACKYGGQARAAVVQEGDVAVVTIDNFGPGIAKEDLERVFRPFERLGQVVPGSGLGLAIVKTIVVDQGGAVRLLNLSDVSANGTV